MTTTHTNNSDALIELFRKALEQLEAGYNPPFVMVIFPDANREDVHGIIGFDSNNVRIAKQFDDIIDKLQEDFRDQLLKRFAGFGLKDLEKVAEQFARDVDKASDRAIDRLRPDAPIKNTSEAKRLLAELMKKK